MTLQQPLAHQPSIQPSDDLDVVSEIATPVVAAATTFQQRLINSMAMCHTEWLDFLFSRWHENMNTATKLSGCHSLPEVQKIYLGYLARSADQYRNEFRLLGAIAGVEDPHRRQFDGLRELRG